MQPDANRQSQLSLEGYEWGDQIVWCPSCPFQYPPKTFGPSVCPECGTQLHVTTVSEELERLRQAAVAECEGGSLLTIEND